MVANEFGEAQGLHRSALFAAGLVLFVLTLVVNAIARWIVMRSSRGSRTFRRTDDSPQAPGVASAVGA